MARLLTAGGETADTTAEGFTKIGTNTITFDTGTVRSGSRSLKYDATAGNLAGGHQFAFTGATSRNYYIRAYVRFAAAPTSTSPIIRLFNGTHDCYAVRLSTTGTLQLWTASSGGTQVGSDSAALSTNTWYRVEMRVKIVAGASDEAELMLEGASVASTAVGNVGDVAPGTLQIGWPLAPGANAVVFMDDVAVNDDQGADQNTWPGDGKVVALSPTADSAGGTGWTLGTGTALGGNGFAAVDNAPPVGVADLAVGSDPKQIRNASANANVSYDATMTTYTAAGIAAVDTINVIDPVIATAAPVTTSSKQGTVGVVSNPAISNVALGAGGTSGAFWSGVAANTFSTGWKMSHGTVTYAPSVTLGTAPVMRVTQVTSSTRIAMVCYMAMMIDYTPGIAPIPYLVMARQGPA